MEVTNCRACGNLFNYLSGSRLCPNCMKKLEKKFMTTKEYIRENPGSNINTVAKECKVSIPQIKKWIREERLSFSQESGIGIECDNCGKMIRTGRFCSECKAKMINQLDNAYEKPKPVVQKKKDKEKELMRFLDKEIL